MLFQKVAAFGIKQSESDIKSREALNKKVV